jgi:hypothetical protein
MTTITTTDSRGVPTTITSPIVFTTLPKLTATDPTVAASVTNAAAAAASSNADGTVQSKPQAPNSGGLRRLSTSPWLTIVAVVVVVVSTLDAIL